MQLLVFRAVRRPTDDPNVWLLHLSPLANPHRLSAARVCSTAMTSALKLLSENSER
jgi:hypothetical protein